MGSIGILEILVIIAVIFFAWDMHTMVRVMRFFLRYVMLIRSLFQRWLDDVISVKPEVMKDPPFGTKQFLINAAAHFNQALNPEEMKAPQKSIQPNKPKQSKVSSLHTTGAKTKKALKKAPQKSIQPNKPKQSKVSSLHTTGAKTKKALKKAPKKIIKSNTHGLQKESTSKSKQSKNEASKPPFKHFHF